jgi:hypothetical protein
VGVAAAAPARRRISAQGPDQRERQRQQQQQQQQQQLSNNSTTAAAAGGPASRAAGGRAAGGGSAEPAQKAAQKAAQEAAQEAAERSGEEEGRSGSEGQGRAEANAKAEAAAKALRRRTGPRGEGTAQRAAAAQRAAVTYNRRGKPQKLVIVRTTSIDSVSNGSLVQRVVRNGRTVSLGALDAAIPSSWMAVDGDTAQLRAAVVLTPGTLLNVEGVKTLQLAGGPDVNDAAFLYTGSGRIQLRNVTVSSIDPTSGQPVGADLAGRPYIKVSDQGRLDATNSDLTDLGTKPTGDAQGFPAVAFGRGSTGTLNGVTMQRNSTGISLAASQSVSCRTSPSASRRRTASCCAATGPPC